MEGRPEQWRTVALGFIEAQVMGEALRQGKHTLSPPPQVRGRPALLKAAALVAVSVISGFLLAQSLKEPDSETQPGPAIADLSPSGKGDSLPQKTSP